VLDRARLKAGGEVVRGPCGEQPVHKVEARRDDPQGNLLHPHRVEQQPGQDDHDSQHDHREGKQALGAPRVETRERHGFGLFQLADQKTGDEETRDHEEDVHAHVAAAREGHPCMVEQHGHDGDGPEALHVGPKPASAGIRFGPGRPVLAAARPVVTRSIGPHPPDR
jgi:hypothetical protein